MLLADRASGALLSGTIRQGKHGDKRKKRMLGVERLKVHRQAQRCHKIFETRAGNGCAAVISAAKIGAVGRVKIGWIIIWLSAATALWAENLRRGVVVEIDVVVKTVELVGNGSGLHVDD